jgi:homoserine kinase
MTRSDESPGALSPRLVRVRVPSSSSNLGAGFDCLGLALSRYLTAEFVPAEDPAAAGMLHVARRGTLRPLDDRADDRDLFVQAFRRFHETNDAASPSGTLTIDSEIPIGRGLGSSGAAIVGGIALAAAALGVPLEASAVLSAAQEFERHLDNVAPALLGGLVAVARDEQDVPQAFGLPLSEALGFAFAAPGAELDTQQARRALPERVALTDAVHNVGAMAALTRALATGDPALLRLGFSDRLHVRYRLTLIPGGEQALAAARAAGAWGATVSGAGSGLIAVTDPGRAAEVADAMAAAFRRVAGPAGVIGFEAEPDLGGAIVE